MRSVKKINIIFFLILSLNAVAIDVQFNKFTQNLSYESLENAILENPHSGKRDKWGFAAAYSYTEDPLSRGVKNTTLTPIIDELHSIQFGLNYKLHNHLELMLSSALHHSGNSVTGENKTLLGDTTLALKYRFISRSNWAMAITPYLNIPTGDEDYFLGGNSLGYGGLLSFERNFKHFGAVLNIGYTNTKDNTYLNIDYENLYHVGIGVRVPFKRFAAQAEYRVNFTDDSNNQRQNELHLGGSYGLTETLRIFSSIGLGNIDFENNNDYRLLAGIKGSFGGVVKEAPVVKEDIPEVKIVKKYLRVGREIHFRTASAEIREASTKLLDSAIVVLLKYQDYIDSIQIEGHTDSRGSSSKNKILSTKRAQAIMDYLVRGGFPAAKLSAVGYGEDRLEIYPEKTEEEFAKNRRVIFLVNEILDLTKKI